MDVFCLDKKDKISLYSFILRKKGLTYICEAFLHGKEHTTGQAFRHAPHFAPGRYALCFPFFSALKRSSLLSIPPSCSMDGRLQDF